MKRFLTLCLLVALLLPCCAGASGLPDLGGSGLPVIGVTNAPSAGYLPDPADILGAKGETYATNYAYTSDYVCTVYLYGLPKDVDGFLRQYNEKAASLGFAVTESQEEGNAAYRYSYGAGYALLFPSYSGRMMLMVPNGMNFGTPKPEGDYIMFTYNGAEVSSVGDDDGLACKLDYDLASWAGSSNYQIVIENWFSDRSYKGIFELHIPADAQTGSVYRSTQKRPSPALYLYNKDTIALWYGDTHGTMLTHRDDYFEVRVTSVEEFKDYFVVELEFDGSLGNGSAVFEDGSIRVTCYE